MVLATSLSPRDALAQDRAPSAPTPDAAERPSSSLGYATLPPPKSDPWVASPSVDPPDRARAGTPSPEPARDVVRPAAPKEPPPVAFDVAAAAEMPIMMGGQATLEVPYRFLFQGEVGVLPGFAVDAVDSALVGAGAYGATTSELVRNGLRGSVVGRVSAGWRPFPDHGFEILGGYTVASFGGGVSARAAVEAAAGMSLPSQIPDTDVVVRSTIHALHVSLGWRWVIADHFLVRMSLGYMQAVGSSSHVEVPDSLAQNATVTAGVAAANQVIDAKLDDIYRTYVKLPVAGLSLGYRF
jgi:hypothetical protein